MGFRLRAMATSMKDLVGSPLDDFAAKFKAEFVRLGFPSTMYVQTDVQPGGGGVSRLVRLRPGEEPPTWNGDDPREDLQGGEWRSYIGGVQFLGDPGAPRPAFELLNHAHGNGMTDAGFV